MKKCNNPNCGANNPDNAQYCKRCGQKIDDASESGKTIIGILSVAGLFLGVYLLYLSLTTNYTNDKTILKYMGIAIFSLSGYGLKKL